MSLAAIAASWPTRHYRRKQILIHEGEEVSQFFYLQSGYVKVYAITDEGEERILLLLKPGDLFPLLKDPEQATYRSLYYYEAMTTVQLGVMEQRKLLDQLRQDQQQSWTLLRYVSEFSSTLTMRLSQLEGKKAEHKLENLLAYLIGVCGRPTKLNAYLLNLKLTHQELANLIGLTRETVSLEIKKLEREGVVVSRNGFLLINPSGLNRPAP